MNKNSFIALIFVFFVSIVLFQKKEIDNSGIVNITACINGGSRLEVFTFEPEARMYSSKITDNRCRSYLFKNLPIGLQSIRIDITNSKKSTFQIKSITYLDNSFHEIDLASIKDMSGVDSYDNGSGVAVTDDPIIIFNIPNVSHGNLIWNFLSANVIFLIVSMLTISTLMYFTTTTGWRRVLILIVPVGLACILMAFFSWNSLRQPIETKQRITSVGASIYSNYDYKSVLYSYEVLIITVLLFAALVYAIRKNK